MCCEAHQRASSSAFDCRLPEHVLQLGFVIPRVPYAPEASTVELEAEGHTRWMLEIRGYHQAAVSESAEILHLRSRIADSKLGNYINWSAGRRCEALGRWETALRKEQHYDEASK